MIRGNPLKAAARITASLFALALPCFIPARGEEPPAEGDADPRVDLYGDPLPEGALARIGTVRFRHNGPVSSVSFSPDGAFLTSGSHDKALRLWETATGREVRRFEGHGGWVTSVSFCPDGMRLAAGYANTTALVWHTFPPHPTGEGASMETLWEDLAAPEGLRAVAWLSAMGEPSAQFLSGRVTIPPPPSPEEATRLRGLVALLDDDDFRTRENAQKDLEGAGGTALMFLRSLDLDDLPPEPRTRVDRIIGILSIPEAPGASGESARQVRAVLALRRIGGESARKILGEIASCGSNLPHCRLARALPPR